MLNEHPLPLSMQALGQKVWRSTVVVLTHANAARAQMGTEYGQVSRQRRNIMQVSCMGLPLFATCWCFCCCCKQCMARAPAPLRACASAALATLYLPARLPTLPLLQNLLRQASGEQQLRNPFHLVDMHPEGPRTPAGQPLVYDSQVGVGARPRGRRVLMCTWLALCSAV